ncbi:MAG: hypothetical protein VX211_01995 [Pseudomonadota bacterium]|uniref:Uncharacterized protein n=1 Tax=marine metagenome TaxID=408172 RepID=A0A381SE33_9ZZZZ|nr:hypothetical protein [Acidobacteriota bacterium]MEE3278539.1 hypothetical protein [Pseudomonadota bacterium]|tara:strand:+ start:645 stop:1067 length:423 start_codon:yes stop_codon:yes gene_type:complete
MFTKLALAIVFITTTTSVFAFEISGDSAAIDMRVTSIISHETGSTITGRGTVEGYGKVWVTLELTSSDNNRSQGVLGGQGRALLDDGSMVGSPFMGNWSRAGHLVTVHFLDNVSNGAQNFVKWTLDLREETIKGVYYAIK